MATIAAAHTIDALPTTAIGKVYKPGLVLDSITRTVHDLVEEHLVDGRVDADLRDSRPHVTISLTRSADTSALTADLDRYSFSHEIARPAVP
jgi:fatty-acyl-CoA synthase